MADFIFGVCIDFNNKERLLQAKEAGVDYYEFGFGSLASAANDDIDEIKEFLKTSQVPCLTSNGMFPSEIKLVGPDKDYYVIDEYLDKASERFASIGGDTVVFGSGGARRCPDDYSYEKATEELVEVCGNHIAPYMKKYGLTCAIEPLRSAECNMVTTAKRGYEICKLANKPEIKLLVDLFHFDCENEPRESILNYTDSLAHIHIASATNNRFYPKEDDGTDYKQFLDILRKAGYQKKRISFEGRCDNFFEELKISLDMLKNM